MIENNNNYNILKKRKIFQDDIKNELGSGYIYIRNAYNYYNKSAVKLGKTKSLIDREDVYITSEIERGNYEMVYELPIVYMDETEVKLHHFFKDKKIYINGGKEFFHKDILHLIEDYFKNNVSFEYKRLSKFEINQATRVIRIKKILKKISKSDLINALKLTANQKGLIKIQPFPHQQELLEMIPTFYRKETIGNIIWPCGAGKALASIFCIKKLKTVINVIGVPSISLQEDMKNEIIRVFSNISLSHIIYIGSNEGLTNEKKIIDKINSIKPTQHQPIFIITTFASSNVLVKILDVLNIVIDFKIGDECHHLVGFKNNKTKSSQYIDFHDIRSRFTLFMTATKKTFVCIYNGGGSHIINTFTNDNGEEEAVNMSGNVKSECQVYSMDDPKTFGNNIDTKTVRWAIENKKITDYSVLVLKNTQEDLHIIIRQCRHHIGQIEHQELFISAYLTIAAMLKYNDLTHVLIYTNTTLGADITEDYVSKLLNSKIFEIDTTSFYHKSLHTKNTTNSNIEISEFIKYRRGIISSVYLFGEGKSISKLNGVVFAENMNSNIRIVQYALRPNRLEKGNPNKKAYILIPYIDKDEWNNDEPSYKKVRNIISKIRNEDEHIEEKIRMVLMNSEKKTQTKTINVITAEETKSSILEEDDDELVYFKMRLRCSKTLYSKLSEEEEEYKFAKEQILKFKITSKDIIYLNNNPNLSKYRWMNDTENFFMKRGVWKGWFDFLNYDSYPFIQSKTEWDKYCIYNDIKTIFDYKNWCKRDNVLPPHPDVMYKFAFTNLQQELDKIWNDYSIINEKRRI
jgi:predicted helicase